MHVSKKQAPLLLEQLICAFALASGKGRVSYEVTLLAKQILRSST